MPCWNWGHFLTSSSHFFLLSRCTVNGSLLHQWITDSLKSCQMTRTAWLLPFLASYVIALPQAVCSRREEVVSFPRLHEVASSSGFLCNINYWMRCREHQGLRGLKPAARKPCAHSLLLPHLLSDNNSSRPTYRGRLLETNESSQWHLKNVQKSVTFLITKYFKLTENTGNKITSAQAFCHWFVMSLCRVCFNSYIF